MKRLGLLESLKGVSLYRNPINDDKKLYVTVILGICQHLESLDHTNVEEIKAKFGILGDDKPPQRGNSMELAKSQADRNKELGQDKDQAIANSSEVIRDDGTGSKRGRFRIPSNGI